MHMIMKCVLVILHLSALRIRKHLLAVDPWDMLNKFCLHVYAQKSLFIGENINALFLDSQVQNAPQLDS